MLASMKRTTIKITDELDAKLRHEAARRGITISDLSREAIEAHLGGPKRTLRFAAAGDSGDPDFASRIDEILAREWGGVDPATTQTSA
jgi:predicted transcriptional regulator